MRIKLIILPAVVAFIALFASCSMEPIENLADGTDSFTTRSFSDLTLSDFVVTKSDIHYYIQYVSAGRSVDWHRPNHRACIQRLFHPEDAHVTPYPDKENPLVYILNYPATITAPEGRWEVISTDKRTEAVLVAGHGFLDMEKTNQNLAGWIKAKAGEIAAVREYSGPIKNDKERYAAWVSMVEFGKYFEKIREGNLTFDPEFNNKNYGHLVFDQTRSMSTDTSYHPVPGHYEYEHTLNKLEISQQISHMISTKWGQGAPFNQYCPKNPDIPGLRAPAGSEAVAGGQVVYWMHQENDGCPEVYGSAYCTAYFGPNMDWDLMEQFDKSSSNWAYFQTSDSTRMAAVMLANIGKDIQMEYGANYSYGDLYDLKNCLYAEYGLESQDMAFNNGVDNPYDHILQSVQECSPVIVHSAGDNQGTLPYTFIVDGYRTGINYLYSSYIFTPDPGYSLPYSIYGRVVHSATPVTQVCMNWGSNGFGSQIWADFSGDWYFSGGDYSNREALLSFSPAPEED